MSQNYKAKTKISESGKKKLILTFNSEQAQERFYNMICHNVTIPSKVSNGDTEIEAMLKEALDAMREAFNRN